MDLAGAYIEQVCENAPNADIAFDPFHVVTLANEAVSEIRRGEAREIESSPEATVLEGSRGAMLKAPKHLRENERARLSEVARLNARVHRAYLLKEEQPRSMRARISTRRRRIWLARVGASLSPASIRQARSNPARLPRWRPRRHSTRRLERPTGRASTTRLPSSTQAYGFHSAAALIAMVFLCCTKMPITLPT